MLGALLQSGAGYGSILATLGIVAVAAITFLLVYFFRKYEQRLASEA